MKRTKKKLQLEAKTVARLSEKNLAQVRGGSDVTSDATYLGNDDASGGQGSVQTGHCAWDP